MFTRRNQSRTSYGWKAIGIRWETITNGMRVTGLGLLMQEQFGFHRTMMARGILWVTGREVELNTTTMNTNMIAITAVDTDTDMIMTMTRHAFCSV